MVFKILSVIMCVLLLFNFATLALRPYSEPLTFVAFLDRLSTFDYDLESVRELLSSFRSGFNWDTYVFWDDNLTGVSGFIVNIGNVVFTFIQYVVDVMVSIVQLLWHLLVDGITFVMDLLDLFFLLLGF